MGGGVEEGKFAAPTRPGPAGRGPCQGFWERPGVGLKSKGWTIAQREGDRAERRFGSV